MQLKLTSTMEIPSLTGQPRHVHNSGAWFADPAGIVAHRMDFPLWRLLGEPSTIEIDFGVSDTEIMVAGRAMQADRPVEPAGFRPVVGVVATGIPVLPQAVNPEE